MTKKLSIAAKIFIGMLAGVVFGVILEFVPSSWFRDALIADGALRIGGQLFINAFRMIVVPVVFVSLTIGVASMNNPALLGRAGLKTLLIYIGTTFVAIVLGLGAGMLFSPGSGLEPMKAAEAAAAGASRLSFSDTLLGVVPTNIFRAFAEEAMLQVIFLAVLCGLALSSLGKRAAAIRNLFDEFNAVNLKIIEFIMHFAPFGIFCLLARTFASFGLSAALPLVKFLLCVTLAMAIQCFLVYGAMLKYIARLSPAAFFRKFFPVMLLAFSTSSSNATLPANIETMVGKMGISERLSTLVLSLGATVNMDGTAIMQGCAVVFIAQLFGIELTLAQIAAVVVTALIASVGTAGVPGAGAIMLAMVLQSAGLPLEGAAMIMGVERLIDMMRTAVNVTGDAVCLSLVAGSEREIDKEVFNRT